MPDLNVLVVEVVEVVVSLMGAGEVVRSSVMRGIGILDDLDDQHVEVWHRARSSVCHVACATHI